jgi:UDP-N-acetylglucosamine 2-epimerase (non-hydrolysing)
VNIKIATVFGTRPEAIKLAPIILALKTLPNVECLVCVTGQHREMLEQVLTVFDIRADQDFALMEPNQSLGRLTARATEALDRYLSVERPDMVLVQGDTTTAFCGALAAFYNKIPIGHVEAGLRTGNLQAPWPEEANRVLTSRLANLHFAPTAQARQNLVAEGVNEKEIYVTGNTVIDALLIAMEKVAFTPQLIPDLPACLQPNTLTQDGPAMVLITGHRRENFGEGFNSICRAIASLTSLFPEVHFVYPVHLNPNVRESVDRILKPAMQSTQNLHLIAPQSYLPFVGLMARSKIILTDSGGVQEEAPSLGKPVLVMRETTERPEAVDAGTVRLVGTNTSTIVSEVTKLLTEPEAYREMSRAHNPYGDGRSAGRIVEACMDYLRVRSRQG